MISVKPSCELHCHHGQDTGKGPSWAEGMSLRDGGSVHATPGANASNVGLANKRPCHWPGSSAGSVMVPFYSLESGFLKWILFIFH